MFRKHFKRKSVLVVVISLVILACFIGACAPEKAEEIDAQKNDPEVKNVIFLIGDGMGPSYTSAYRYLKDDPSTKFVENTAFDEYLVGQQKTYSEDPEQNVTDSASAATAMSSGVKTYNQAIAVDNDKSEVKTVLEAAKEKGKATGLVATSEITNATPAAFGSHDTSRKNMNDIADDYYDERIKGKHKIDVLLGGGTDLFIRKDRDLTKEFKKDGYSYVSNRNELLEDTNGQVLGLFAPMGLDKMIDRSKEQPSLGEMTKSAIERLKENKNGFFLLVEGSQIDWAGHDNDIVAAMSEIEDFEKAFQVAIDFAKEDKHTLVVATADHSTGGFTIGADGNYNWYGKILKAAKRTPDFMAQQIANGAKVEDVLGQYIDLDLTKKEIKSVTKAAKLKKATTIDNAIEDIFNRRTFTGWTTWGHTGEDVPIYAYGPCSDRFAGLLENTDNAKIIFELLDAEVEITDK